MERGDLIDETCTRERQHTRLHYTTTTAGHRGRILLHISHIKRLTLQSWVHTQEIPGISEGVFVVRRGTYESVPYMGCDGRCAGRA